MAPQVVILAGGLGTRLRPLTHTVPKPLIPVAHRPFLEHVLSLVARQGLERVVLLIGHLGEQVQAHFRDGADMGVAITYVQEPEPRGTAGAIRDARDVLEDTFLLVNGDTYLDCDYSQLHDRLLDAGVGGVMAVYANLDAVAPNNVRVTAGGGVAEYSKTGSVGMTHVDAGAYALRRSTLDRLPATTPASLEFDLFPRLALAGELAAFEVSSRFYDIGTLQQLAEAERILV